MRTQPKHSKVSCSGCMYLGYWKDIDVYICFQPKNHLTRELKGAIEDFLFIAVNSHGPTVYSLSRARDEFEHRYNPTWPKTKRDKALSAAYQCALKKGLIYEQKA